MDFDLKKFNDNFTSFKKQFHEEQNKTKQKQILK